MQHRVTVRCDQEHDHELVLESDGGHVLGAAKPGPIPIAFTCPRSGRMRKTSVVPPRALRRPIVVVEVRDACTE